MNTSKTNTIVLYGTTWCGDCLRAKTYLDSVGAEYTFIDISADEEALKKVLEINNGMQSVPTIVFPNGHVLIEPSNAQLAQEISNPSPDKA